jgi:adenosylcobyric acid synthase
MRTTRPLMIFGTASASGKSLIATALCRILHRRGVRVAPFKAQNMSNNSWITVDGLEMGRAQVVQALAAGIEPDVRMNPVLIKPSSAMGAQVVCNGKAAFNMNARMWKLTRDRLRDTVRKAYTALADEYDVIILEGAGSPAEINLKKNDIVNTGMAEMADAPVLIVGDIDRGGVFASLAGTVQLFEEHERNRVKGFIINKFRGDVELLKPGLDELERITGIPVIGVVPWVHHTIDDEDAETERFSKGDASHGEHIEICIIRLPHISNFTDFIPFETMPGIRLRWCDFADRIGKPDMVILPGSKATIDDLNTIRKAGIVDAVKNYAENSGVVLGICGGFQMLGDTIIDKNGMESDVKELQGIGLLEMTTEFHAEKQTKQTAATVHFKNNRLFDRLETVRVDGYEIHMGRTIFGDSCIPFTTSRNGETNGVCNPEGNVIGTYLHGLFDSGQVVAGIVSTLRERKGYAPVEQTVIDRQVSLMTDIDRFADAVAENIDLKTVFHLLHRDDYIVL